MHSVGVFQKLTYQILYLLNCAFVVYLVLVLFFIYKYRIFPWCLTFYLSSNAYYVHDVSMGPMECLLSNRCCANLDLLFSNL